MVAGFLKECKSNRKVYISLKTLKVLMSKIININRDWLYQKYVIEKLHTGEIAKLCNCGKTSILNYLKKYDIPVRKNGEDHNPNARWDLLNNESWLYKEYVINKSTIKYLSNKCKCNKGTIRRYLCKYKIELRNKKGRWNPKIKYHLLNNKRWLENKYINEQMTTREIAKICNCDRVTITNYLKEYGIELRKGSFFGWHHTDDAKQKISKAFKGENHPNWKGGYSESPYCDKWTDSLKEKIRNKNDRVCFICGKTEDDNGKRLSVHHIDYNKMQGCEDNIQVKKYKFNLIPLCVSCHSRTNNNRYYWFGLLYNNWVFNEEINFYTPIYYPL